MSTEDKATSGADTVTSGTVETKEDVQVQATSGATDNGLVDKLKREKDNFRERALKAERALEEKERAGLEAKEEYKKLYELEKQKVGEHEQVLAEMRVKQQTAEINSKLRDELTRLGCKPESIQDAFKLIDRSTVNVDPETGLILGAEDAAKMFQEKYSQYGFFSRASVGVSQTAPNTKPVTDKSVGEMTTKEKLELLAKAGTLRG